jgi:V-type H+-transporting ATPase subunit a
MLLTVVTFPFTFGVMFGDVGHGLALLLIGVYMCMLGPKLLDLSREYGQTMYDARYMIAMMGFFAVYAGFLYNDFLSLGLELFPSRYVPPADIPEHAKEATWVPAPGVDFTNTGVGLGPYPFGLDPVWHGATNELLFVNSMKMKIAVLLGVVQMFVGVLLSFVNGFHNRSAIEVLGVCVPQVIFLCSFFGYMDWMIIYKWINVTTAPSIINLMISMGLMQPIPNALYEGQEAMHGMLLSIIMLCIPAMLIPKPAYFYFKKKSKRRSYAELGEDDEEAHEEHGDFSELCIHQVIETIEFVLGSISHTASYLRLWALSLAHQQLSVVFFSKTILGAMYLQGFARVLGIFVGMTVFICVSTSILLGMDVLECFLHTLRLHWVEFQSKFYKADGRAFAPYSHRLVLTGK